MSGPFGLCSGITQDGKYYAYGETQLNQCCMGVCDPLINECKNTCININNYNDKNRCNRVCDDIIKTCDWNCSMNTNSKNIGILIYNGIKNNGCGDQGVLIDKECMITNKENIIKDCMNSCIPTSDIGCDKYCHSQFSKILSKEEEKYMIKNKPHEFSPFSSFSSFDTSSSHAKCSKVTIIMYVLFILIILILICYIIYLCMKNKK